MILIRARAARAIRACSAGIVCVAAATGAAPAQFKTGTALVVVDVVVTGEDGRLVPDLTAADFELFENGRARAIDQFQFLDFRKPPSEALPPAGVSSNAAEPGGIFALVLDELNLSRRYTPALRRWAKQFINETLQPHDYAVVLRSGGDSGMLFTNDRAMLTMIAESAAGRSGAEATLGPGGVGQGANTGTPPARPGLPSGAGSGDAARGAAGSATSPAGPGARDGGGPSMNQDRAFVAAQGLEMLLKAVQRLGTIPSRRKAVLWFSEGVPCDVETVIAGEEGCARIGQKLREILKAAVASNVAIYGVDPRGLYLEDSVGSTPVEAGRLESLLDSLRTLSSTTGGTAVINNNRPEGALARVAEENRAYYLIGYVSDVAGGDRERTRNLEVRVRHEGVNVRHRTAYLPGVTPSKPDADPLQSLLPARDVTLWLTPAIDNERPGRVQASFEAPTVPSSTTARYTLVAFDLRGRQRARQTGVMTPSAGEGVLGTTTLSLPKGWYQLRLLVEVEGRRGTVFADVLVP
jgi:VWFA-related protein